MRLVKVSSQSTVVEFVNNEVESKTIIHSKWLKNLMKMIGVQIPHHMAASFGGKRVVKLKDDLFQRAFKEVYYKKMDHTKYKWVDDDQNFEEQKGAIVLNPSSSSSSCSSSSSFSSSSSSSSSSPIGESSSLDEIKPIAQKGYLLLKKRVKHYDQHRPASLSQGVLSVKAAFLDPLCLLLSDLSVNFFNSPFRPLDKVNTLDIVDSLVEVFDEESRSLLKWAVCTLYSLQSSLHLFYGQENDVALLHPDPTCMGIKVLTQKEKVAFQQIFWLILDPLYSYLSTSLKAVKGDDIPLQAVLSNISLFNLAADQIVRSARSLKRSFQKRSEILETLQIITGYSAIIQHNFYKRLSSSKYLEPFRERYIDLLEKTRQPELLALLLHLPNPAGYRQKERVMRRDLHEAIKTMTTVKEVRETDYRVEGGFKKPRYLKKAVAEYLFDSSGNWRAPLCPEDCIYFTNGVHLRLIQVPRSDREYPFYPSQEQGVSTLMMRLFGHGTTMGELVYISNGSTSSTSQSSSDPSGSFIYISQMIQGENVDGHYIDELDRKQLSEFLLTIPLSPPGNQRLNFLKIETTRDELGRQIKQIVCTNHSLSWIEPLHENKLLGFKTFTYQLYVPLFTLLPEFILDSQAIEAFLSLNPFSILKTWFRDLEKLNQKYSSSFQDAYSEQFHDPISFSISPFFELDKGQGGQIFLQFCYLQSFLKRNQNRPVYAHEILEQLISVNHDSLTEVGPKVCKKYLEAREISPSALHQMKWITGRDEKQFPNLDRRRAKGVELIRPKELICELKAFQAMGFHQLSIFQDKGPTCQVGGDFNKFPDNELQQTLLTFILKLRCDKLDFSHFPDLTDDILIELLNKNRNDLVDLNLSGCLAITEKSIAQIAENCPYLERLYVSECENLATFSNPGFFDNIAIFPWLQELSVTNCPKLVSIDIQATNLRTLIASDNNLKSIKLNITGNHPLSRISFSGNKIDQTAVATLASSLKHCNSMTSFDLSNNEISDRGMFILSQVLPSTISSLYLANNQVTSNGVQAIEDLLQSTSTLDLSNNLIADTSTQIFARLLTRNNPLLSLNLSHNNIRNYGAIVLAEAVQFNSRLSSLNLSNNCIGDRGAEAFLNALKTNTSLTFLNLKNNPIGSLTRQTLSQFFNCAPLSPIVSHINDALKRNVVIQKKRQSVSEAYPLQRSFDPSFSYGEGLKFQYNGQTYQVEYPTRSHGACALHALLGTLSDDEYVWNPVRMGLDAENDSFVQLAAKRQFLKSIEPILSQENDLKEILLSCMKERLIETEEFKSDFLPFDEELANFERAICLKLTEFYEQHSEWLNQVFVNRPLEYGFLVESYQSDLVGTYSFDLLNSFNANYKELKEQEIDDPNWSQILTLKEVIINLEQNKKLRMKAFLSSNFQLYSAIIENGSCYLSVEELKFAAKVLLSSETQILIFFDLNENPYVINPAGRSIIAIVHSIAFQFDGRHFSRLTQVL